MAHGGSLTVNPQTGLPEAGFLDRLLPTLLGGAATFFSGGAITPFMAAMGVGGLTALTSKDLGKGLMAGLGAYGGAGIAGGLMNFGEAAIGAEAAKGALPSGIDPVGADAVAYEAGQAAAEKTARAGASNFDRLSRGVTEGFKNPMGAFSSIGGGSKLQGAAMIGAPIVAALAGQDQTSVPTAKQIKFDPSYANINIRRDQLPYQRDTGSSAQRGYFGPTYVNRNAAEGGFVSDDGIQHFASGGIPLDPTYDYSGYGRKKTDVVRPVTPLPDVPKPDFVGADGKTYRYDPVKRSWYVFKDVPEKTNPGVATLMGSDGVPGNNVVGDRPEGSYNMGSGVNPYAGSPQALANGPLGIAAGMIGNAFSTPKTAAEIEATPVEDRTGVPTQAQNTGVAPAAPAGPDPNAGEGGVGGVGGPGGIGGGVGTGVGTAADNGGGDGAAPQGNNGGIGNGQPFAYGGMAGYAQGGLGSLGGYSDGGRLLRGPGDGVSDSIPATVGNRQPARLANNEFVIPARIVSEIGNGSTDAGARRLYQMMDRIQKARKKSMGKGNIAVDSKAYLHLPA